MYQALLVISLSPLPLTLISFLKEPDGVVTNKYMSSFMSLFKVCF